MTHLCMQRLLGHLQGLEVLADLSEDCGVGRHGCLEASVDGEQGFKCVVARDVRALASRAKKRRERGPRYAGHGLK